VKIAFCSSEIFPFAKTGGLADVSGALPLSLAKQGCQVKVFMPFYKGVVPQKNYEDFGYTKKSEVEFYFIKNDAFFMRDALYGTPAGDYPDNLERFSFFSRQVLEVLKKIKFTPHIVHVNDWQASLITIYLKTLFNSDKFFKDTRCILTIHNLAYQGIFDKEKFPLLGIPWDYFNMRYLEFYNKINLLKGGIVCADMVNTVSPNYAEQIKTVEYGCGLDGVLKEKGKRLCGILNAIDYSVWNPKTDPFIYTNYSLKSLEDKYINKKRFQKNLGLKVSKNTLLLGMVSRLVEQKGVDIFSKSIDRLLKKYQVVVLGFGEEKYHKILKRKAYKYKDSLSLNLKFDEKLAHRIYASCDCFLMPSRFEPCGLSQLISYKYATVPIVHRTGGLADTVLDADKKGGGFVFKDYSAKDLVSCTDRAFRAFSDKAGWRKLISKISKYNFSWNVAAQEYLKIYKGITKQISQEAAVNIF